MSLILLFLSSFAAATVLPLSSEVPLAVIVRQTQSWPVPVLVATAAPGLAPLARPPRTHESAEPPSSEVASRGRCPNLGVWTAIRFHSHFTNVV